MEVKEAAGMAKTRGGGRGTGLPVLSRGAASKFDLYRQLASHRGPLSRMSSIRS